VAGYSLPGLRATGLMTIVVTSGRESKQQHNGQDRGGDQQGD
jgi:hypothetical protein